MTRNVEGCGDAGTSITVIMVEDHPVYRDGMSAAISRRPELELVDECAEVDEAIQAIRRLRPDVGIIDVELSDRSGLEILRATGSEPTRMLMLSSHKEGAFVEEAVSAGAAGYVYKGRTRQEICDAAVAVGRGETVLTDEAGQALFDHIRRRGERGGVHLTEQERRLLPLLAAGASDKVIALRWNVSATTVKTHVSNLCTKLDAQGRTNAVAKALALGLFEYEPDRDRRKQERR